MDSAKALTYAGTYERKEPGLQEKGRHGFARGDTTTTLGVQTISDPPRQDAIRSREPPRIRRFSAPPSFYAVSAYRFSSLQEGYIRLLRLLPNPYEHAPIQCQLFDHRFDRLRLDSRKGTHLYEALSYFWGSPNKCRSILVDDRCLPVTENLHAALLRLRDPSLPRILWIDAICIDQGNHEERNRQVQLMAIIYARASRVLVWLEEVKADGDQHDGDAMTNGDYALEVIGHLAADGRPREFPRKDQNAVLTLLRRSWFQRIWVLQEVAAAQHVVIITRTMEMDGYAFCSGWNVLNLATDELGTQSRMNSMSYLMKRTVFPLRPVTTCSDRFSLYIRPLSELMDMYNDRKASDLRDKVYALLGMSSDLPVGKTPDSPDCIKPDYGRPWKELFCHLVKSIVGEQATVTTWDEKEDEEEIAIIKSRVCVLGEVSESLRDGHVCITWESPFDTKEKQSSHFTLPTSAKPVKVGDIVCLLQGASKPTIIRPCNGYSAIIMIAVRLDDDSRPAVIAFPHDILLLWDWKASQVQLQDVGRYECPISSQYGPKCPGTECSCQDLDRAMSSWNFGLFLNAVERYEEAGKNLSEAVSLYGTAMGTSNIHSLWREANEEVLMVMEFLLIDGKAAAIEAECKIGGTPLLWATKNSHRAVIQLLLEKGAKVEGNKNTSKTPLSWAAENGHEAVLQLLLEKGADIEAVDMNDSSQTPLMRAAKNGHEAVVRLLLERGANTEPEWYKTPLSQAAENGHEAVVQLLLERGADVEPQWYRMSSLQAADTMAQLFEVGANVERNDIIFETPLWQAAENGHTAIVRLLLKNGANVEGSKIMFEGLMSWAKANDFESIVQSLLKERANIEAKEKDIGLAPLSRAKANGHEAVVQLLLENGAMDYRE